MLGHKLWNSLTAEFQVEISVKAAEFKKGREYDGPLLWDFIRRRVNPTTTVGASKLKEELENVKLSKFDGNVVKYNTWFEDIKKEIIREEGAGKYNEYLRCLFRAYLTCSDKEFVDAVKDEKRKWQQGKLAANYAYSDLMELGRLTYVNLLEDGTYDKSSRTPDKEKSQDEKKFLALATEILQNMKGQKGGDNSEPDGKGVTLRNGRELKPWRFENPNNEKEKKLSDGTIMRWCSNDCHPKPMWCGRKNCMNRAEYAEKMKSRKETETKNKSEVSEDFKIALAAMTSADDFASLKDQFFSGN